MQTLFQRGVVVTKRRVVLLAALLLPEISIPAQLRLHGADDRQKPLDAVRTTEKFLADALAGRNKEAAALGEPGHAYSREDKIKEVGGLGVKKIALVRVLADDRTALAITEPVVEPKRKQKGSLQIRLVNKDKRWMIRDVDFGAIQEERNLKRFQREHPKAKEMIPKKDK